MALRDPVAVYDAATNVEAHLVKLALIEAGVDAFVLEDVSPVGLWMFGTLPEIHKPQVFVNKSDVDQAEPILREYRTKTADRAEPDQRPPAEIEVVCEECGESTMFPASKLGSVEECSRCGAYVDVGEVDDSNAYWIERDDT